MAGYRKVLPRNEALERLMEERDDLKIQIHLVAEKLDAATLRAMRHQVGELERKIDACWRAVKIKA
jgi:hypothetical protein